MAYRLVTGAYETTRARASKALEMKKARKPRARSFDRMFLLRSRRSRAAALSRRQVSKMSVARRTRLTPRRRDIRKQGGVQEGGFSPPLAGCLRGASATLLHNRFVER